MGRVLACLNFNLGNDLLKFAKFATFYDGDEDYLVSHIKIDSYLSKKYNQ